MFIFFKLKKEIVFLSLSWTNKFALFTIKDLFLKPSFKKFFMNIKSDLEIKKFVSKSSIEFIFNFFFFKKFFCFRKILSFLTCANSFWKSSCLLNIITSFIWKWAVLFRKSSVNLDIKLLFIKQIKYSLFSLFWN